MYILFDPKILLGFFWDFFFLQVRRVKILLFIIAKPGNDLSFHEWDI